MTGSIVHFWNHAASKGALFGVVGIVVLRAGSPHIDNLPGMGRRAPWTAAAMTAAALSLVGVPLTGGFLTKYYLAEGALEAGQGVLLVFILVSSLLTAVYMWRCLQLVWFADADVEPPVTREVPWTMRVATVTLGAACVVFGVFAWIPVDIASAAAARCSGAADMAPVLASLATDAGPALSVGLCLLAIPLIALLRNRPNLREAASLAVATLNFALVASIYAAHGRGEEIAVELLRITDDLRIAFRVDDLGLIFALTASFLWILNTLYSIGYMRAHHEHKQTRFYICFAAAIAAAMGAAFSSNLFSLFVFYEVLTLVTYPLVIHAETKEAKAGARRYLVYLLGLSIAFQLPALFMVKAYGGTFEFHAEGLLRASTASAGTLSLIFLLFLLGIGKAALMPFHSWLPAAMVAPTPVSALLHAVAVVKAGVFTVSRVVFHVFGVRLLGDLGVHEVLVCMACFTIVTASLIALAQDNLKRRLAYSTITQLSYVLLGVGLLVPEAQAGGLAHIGMHASSKITLFFCAGAILVATHKTASNISLNRRQLVPLWIGQQPTWLSPDFFSVTPYLSSTICMLTPFFTSLKSTQFFFFDILLLLFFDSEL